MTDPLFHAETLAPHIHETYRELSHEEGWAFRWDVPYEELPEEMKGDNLAAARRIPEVLAVAGLRLEPDTDGDGTTEDVQAELADAIEVLAEAEHNGWMQHKLDNGWQYATERDNNQKQHNCLIPYAVLREKEKKKDRNSVLTYPRITARAGYQIVMGRR